MWVLLWTVQIYEQDHFWLEGNDPCPLMPLCRPLWTPGGGLHVLLRGAGRDGWFLTCSRLLFHQAHHCSQLSVVPEDIWSERGWWVPQQWQSLSCRWGALRLAVQVPRTQGPWTPSLATWGLLVPPLEHRPTDELRKEQWCRDALPPRPEMLT